MQPVPAGYGPAPSGSGVERGVHGRLSASSRPSRLWRRQGVVLSYTQSLAGELKGTGVSATALCPGPVDTGFGDRAGFSKAEAEAILPSVMWVTAADVARAGVEGMAQGRMVVIPGKANRVAASLAQVTPRSLLMPILTRGHPGLRR